MNIDLSLVRGIIRSSLKDSRDEGISEDLSRQRAMFQALKAMHILCEGQPLSQMNVEVHNAASPQLERAIRLTMEPDFAAIIRLLPEMIQQERSA